jgi:cobalamin-dependent methionine synthase I
MMLFLAEKVYPILEEWKAKIKAENLLHPQVVYGYFPVQAEGNDLYVYDPAAEGKVTEVITQFNFPRQKTKRRLCIADFFAPKESGIVDVFPMQAVTMGQIATDYAQELFQGDRYTDYLYFHGIAVQMAEALAEWTHAGCGVSWALVMKNPTIFAMCCSSAIVAPGIVLAILPAQILLINLSKLNYWIPSGLV